MAVVLLSGGLDSALNLALAVNSGRARLALNIRYGQRAEAAEARAAAALSAHYKLPFHSLDLRWLGNVNQSSLTQASQALPQPELAELDRLDIVEPSMRAVWVANRNGLFLNTAAAYAEAVGDAEVLVGFNREEAATFPDNSAAYMEALNQALAFSTLNKVKIASYTLEWDKAQILQEALRVELPLDLVWSCYEPGPERCWRCESCRRSERALLGAGEAGRRWLGRLGATK